MSISSHGAGPLAVRASSIWLGPHRNMVIEEVGEMIRNEVLSRHPQVHRIPVEELSTEEAGGEGTCKQYNTHANNFTTKLNYY